MVTLKDISEKCHVSIATVSKAVNWQSDIGMETANHIRQVARKMGYFPNANARALKTNRSHNLGVLFVDDTSSGLRHEFFSAILESFKVEAESLGYDISFISKDIGKLSMSYYGHAKYRNCDGVMIACVDYRDPSVIELANSEIPVVTLDYVFDRCTSILSDNVGGMAEIVDYLAGMGHRNIAYIHGEDTSVTQKRLSSFHSACQKHGIRVPDSHVISARYHDPQESAKAARSLLTSADPPSCIIFPDDYSFLGGLSEIEKLNLRIPDDISVVGYDGIQLSRLLRPRLTTFEQDAQTMGRLAAEQLIQCIENPRIYAPQGHTIPGKLSIGDSVKNLSTG